MRLSDDLTAILHFMALGLVIVTIYFIGLFVVRPALDTEVADFGAASFMGAMIVLAVAFWSAMRDTRIASIERMVKALYDHSGLDGNNGGSGRHDDK